MWKLKSGEGRRLPKAAGNGTASGPAGSSLGSSYHSRFLFRDPEAGLPGVPESSMVIFISVRVTLTAGDRKLEMMAAYFPTRKVQRWAVQDW